MEHDFLEVERARLHYVRAGAGPLVVFLHGFPQTWYCLRHQVEHFATDHLAVAMDLRGYGDSSRPERLEDYGCYPMVEDIDRLADHLGREHFVLVGHDFGSAVAWCYAMEHPERLDALVILTGAHPGPFDRAMRESEEQQRASGYMVPLRQRELYGQTPAGLLAADDFALLRAQFDFPFITPEALEVYLKAWRSPGGLEAMLRWYQRLGIGPADDLRAPLGNYATEIARQVVEVPTLVIYPDADIYTRPVAHEGLEKWVPDLTFNVIPGGSHWIGEEEPDLVNRQIREFLAAKRIAGSAKPRGHRAVGHGSRASGKPGAAA